MAVYKIFPHRDATLYSAFPNMNTGDDAILEVYNLYPALAEHSPRVARSIIDFDQWELDDVINTKISSSVGGLVEGNWKAYLKLFIAEATGLNNDVTLEVGLVSGSFENGSGKFDDKPQSVNGVSWNWADASGSRAWNTPGGDIRNTSQEGIFTQSMDSRNILDINVEVKQLVDVLRQEDAIIDHGNLIALGEDSFIIKLSGSAEFKSGSAYQPHFKFFSTDTNTIYPPQLELRWNDVEYNTGSLSEISTSNLFIGVDNNPGTFYSESVNRFRLNVRPEYPTRTFQTSSLYTTNHFLPSGSSCYAVKDLDTNEYVIDFDKSFTHVSCDSNGNYFDLYMNGLQPERYYKLLIQTTISGSTIVKDEDYIFKVING